MISKTNATGWLLNAAEGIVELVSVVEVIVELVSVVEDIVELVSVVEVIVELVSVVEDTVVVVSDVAVVVAVVVKSVHANLIRPQIIRGPAFLFEHQIELFLKIQNHTLLYYCH